MPWSNVWGGKVNEWANGNNFGYPAGVRVAVPMSDEHLNHVSPTTWSLEQAQVPEPGGHAHGAELTADPKCWKTYSLETPEFGRDLVDVEMDRAVTTNSMAKTILKHQARLDGSIRVISNKASMINGVQTPISARGSNGYIGQDLLQTMMFLAPEVHEQMLVFNAYTGRDDCVLLYHMDIFNQTCGRNLGYRRKGDAKHYLIAHPKVFAFLVESAAFAYSRYDIVVHVTKRQRITIRASSQERAA